MRLVAYVRVSRVGGREGPSFISPEVQRAQIEGWAAGRAEIIAWHTDLDVSGGTMERPGLDAAMRAVRSGAAEGIVVAKIDRFARSLGGALDAIAERAVVLWRGEAPDDLPSLSRRGFTPREFRW